MTTTKNKGLSSQGMAECRDSLKDVDTKLRNLKRAIERYRANCCEIVTEDDLKTPERLYRLAQVKEPPRSISRQVTEITTVMRTALDHLIFLIVQKAKGSAIPDGVRTPYFPTIQNEALFDQQLREDQKRWGISDEVVTWLKSHQGYTAPDPKNRVLIQLNELARVTKHRFHVQVQGTRGRQVAKLNPLITFDETTRFENNTIDGITIRYFRLQKGELKNGEIVARVALGKHVAGDLILRPGIQFPSVPITRPLLQEEMDAFMNKFDVHFELAHQILFGPGSGLAEGLSIDSLLDAINGYLKNHIFGSNPITDSL